MSPATTIAVIVLLCCLALWISVRRANKRMARIEAIFDFKRPPQFVATGIMATRNGRGQP